MTEIDVPDWVVKAAEDARVRCLNAVTAYGSAGVDERYHMAMKAALTAALGAWVVPVPQFGDASSDSEWFDGVLTSIDPDDTFYKTRTLFTLRQEKPE